jgi:F0F1-type ATP synthase assembly protein I
MEYTMQVIQQRIALAIAHTLLIAACLIIGAGLLLYTQQRTSFYLGAACHFIPHCLLAHLTFRQVGAPYSKQIIRRFYLGEMSKFILIIAFMLLCHILFAINMMVLVSGLVTSIGCCAITPMFMDK